MPAKWGRNYVWSEEVSELSDMLFKMVPLPEKLAVRLRYPEGLEKWFNEMSIFDLRRIYVEWKRTGCREVSGVSPETQREIELMLGLRRS